MTSAVQQNWSLKTTDERLALALSQRFSLNESVARFLAAKGIDVESTPLFLNPRLRDHLIDPFLLKDMDRAVGRTVEALLQEESIGVYGDYDVDGATSSALLRRYFRDIGVEADLYIPDRIDEGYGANTQALLGIQLKGIKLVLMVDCGTTAFEPLSRAKEVGLDVIVLDHHISDVKFPPCVAIVNPNRFDQQTLPQDYTILCAAGVCFIFLIALQKKLRETDFFKERTEPDLLTYLDIVALGTVCDVMPLVGVNRALVAQGLKVIHHGKNKGIRALSEVASLNEKASTYHLGFLLGPRINAGGRVGECDLGSRLLYEEDPEQARMMAEKLDHYNKKRQEIEKCVLEQALEKVESKRLYVRSLIIVDGDDFHPGVIGIVASRLKEIYKIPVCVVSFTGDDGKGSGRSIPSIHLGDAMHRAVHLNLLQKGGGHSMAAGFSLHRSQLEPFYAFLDELFAPLLLNRSRDLFFDACLSLSSLTPGFLEQMQRLEPFGPSNPQPRFLFSNVLIHSSSLMGQDHSVFYVKESLTQKPFKMMVFKIKNNPLFEFLEKNKKKPIDIVATVKVNTWLLKTQVCLMPEDVRLSMDFCE